MPVPQARSTGPFQMSGHLPGQVALRKAAFFDDLDADARICGEVSCIAKDQGRLVGRALDPISAGLAWEGIVTHGHFGRTGGHVLCLGTGGAALAIGAHQARRSESENRPERLIAVDRPRTRLEGFGRVVDAIGSGLRVSYVERGCAPE